MKTSKYLFIQIIALAIYFAIVASCTKKPEPNVYGKWETVEAFGFHWEFTITRGAQLCRRLPNDIPQTSFCFDYSVDESGTGLVVQTPDPETWAWEFIGDDGDVADVLVTAFNGEKTRYILKRIN